MKFYGFISQVDRMRKTAKIEVSINERLEVDYSGRSEESPTQALAIFEPLILDSLTNQRKITVHVDEECRVYMIERLDIGSFG